MEFHPKIKVTPLSQKIINVPNEYEIEDNKIKVIETMKREGYFSIPEVEKIIKSIDERISFNKFQISEERINQIKKDIKRFEENKQSFINILKRYKNELGTKK
jgi:DNA repair ATPase RecN